jgi:hypothetical protein
LFSEIAFALIVLSLTSSFGQEFSCEDEFFRVSRRAGSCQDFFVCMIGGRVDFSCDAGEIFDPVRIQCRAGNRDTCEYTIPQIPADACENDFLRVSEHPG